MTLDWDELDNQFELFKEKLDLATALTDTERGLIIMNIRGFVAQLRGWGYGRQPSRAPKWVNPDPNL